MRGAKLVREHRFTDAAALSDVLAVDLHQLLARALRDRGVASLVVSGGRTPLLLFRRLRLTTLDWSRIFITLADERWVDPADPASNEGLLRSELLRDAAASAHFVPLKNAAPTPQQGAAETWKLLEQVPRPFDAVLLGMGDDGHTASLFPGSPGILEALDPQAAPACVAMSAPVHPNARLSLNLAALAECRQLVLHISGDSKWQVYESALLTATRAEIGELDLRSIAAQPVSAALCLRRANPRVYWSP
jgi:6-phosphogluconolactonase